MSPLAGTHPAIQVYIDRMERNRHSPDEESENWAQALERVDLVEDDLVQLLRHPRVTAGHLRRIAMNPRWTRWYGVKKALVQHPAAPLPITRRLLPQLFWKELADTGSDLRLHPVIRRHAEDLLKVRQQGLTRGEKIALARRATAGVIPALIAGGDSRVHVSLLGNPRLVEKDAVAIAKADDAARESLSMLAKHPRWGTSHRVRFAMMENPRTPTAVALRLLHGLPAADLRRLMRNAKVPRLIRVGAERAISAPTRLRSGWGAPSWRT